MRLSGRTTLRAVIKSRWPAKHDTILVYVKDPDRYYYDAEAVEPRADTWRPGLVGPEKAAKESCRPMSGGSTIVPTNGREKTGYPTQKPRKASSGG